MAFGFWKFLKGLNIVPKSSSDSDAQGDIEVLSTDGKARFHNGTTNSPIVTEAHSATLTNKTITTDGGSKSVFSSATGTARNVEIDASGATDSTSTTLDFNQTANRTVTFPDATTTVVGTDTTQTLTNKTIDGDDNTVQDLPLTSIKTVLADANKVIERDASGIPVSGQTRASSAYVGISDTQTLTNKTLVDSTTSIVDDGDNTKALKFQVSGITTGTTRTLTAPDANTTIAGTDATQTLTNKSLVDSSTQIIDDGDNTKIAKFQASGITTATTRTFTFPDANTTFLGTDATQTVTNKDIDGGTASNTSRITLPKASKSTLDALTRKEATVVYASDEDRVYYDDGTTLRPVGSGSGSDVNFMILDTTFKPLKTDNSDAETSVGDWVTYDDGASATPVDMTGGSPSQLTFSRTTTSSEVLDGTAGFKLVKAAADAQGEGISCTANIPIGYRGMRASISFPFQILSGSMTYGDLRFYVYDVTNSQLITPSNNYIQLSKGVVQMYIDIPSTTTQIRVGFHFATTSTTAVSFVFDDVVVEPYNTVVGSAINDWVQYTPTFTAFTPTNVAFYWRRNGDTIEIRGSLQWGSGTASEARIGLPAGLQTAGSDKVPSQLQVCGFYFKDGSSTTHGGSLTFEPSKTYFTLAGAGAFSGADEDAVTKINGDYYSTQTLVFSQISIPIYGWSSGVVTVNNNPYYMSNFLANGTRVTGSAPTSLGQYRSYLRNGSASTYTETNGSPTTAPSAADGIVIYNGGAYSAADGNNKPSKYEIFIGKNKTYRLQFYSSAGRTGFLDASPNLFTNSGATQTRPMGFATSYDPTTGILTLVRPLSSQTSAEDVHYLGADSAGLPYASTAGTAAYFDIFVSDDITGAQVAPRSELWFYSGTSYGSTANKIPYYTTVGKSIGTDMTYSNSSTNGLSVTILTSGVYSVYVGCAYSATDGIRGISLNASDLTMSITSGSFPPSQILGGQYNATNGGTAAVSVTTYLNAGDIVRPHMTGATIADVGYFNMFRVTRVI